MRQEEIILTLTIEVPCYVEKITKDNIVCSIKPSKDEWTIKNVR